MISVYYLLLVLLYCTAVVVLSIAVPERAVLLLNDVNFDAALAGSSYIPVLFCDKASLKSALRLSFDVAAKEVLRSGKYCETCDIAMVITDDDASKQIMRLFSVKVPSIKLFRSGGLYDYFGPLDDSTAMTNYFIADSKPPITVLSDFKEFKNLFSKVTRDNQRGGFGEVTGTKTVLGYFSSLKETIAEKLEGGDSSSSISSTSSTATAAAEKTSFPIGGDDNKAPWINFMETAESLRGRANFYAFSNSAIMKKLKEKQKPPFIFMIQENGDLFEYSSSPSSSDKSGYSETALTNWILHNTDLGLIDLSSYNANIDIYISKFVAAPSLKFTLFLDKMGDALVLNNMIGQWDYIRLQKSYSSSSTTTDMSNSIAMSYAIGKNDPDVFAFYRLADFHLLKFPFIAAFNPSNNHVYKSDILLPSCESQARNVDGAARDEYALASCQDYSVSMLKFVTDVVSGIQPRSIRSQDKPSYVKGQKIIPVVGSTLLDAISIPNIDAFLLMYMPYSQKQRSIRSSYELLGKSLADEKRIVLLSMNAQANEFPEAWNIIKFPILLWFPAIKKNGSASDNNSSELNRNEQAVRLPIVYNGPSFEVFDLLTFIRKMSSFDPSTLNVVDSNQLNKLVATESSVLELIDYDEHFALRNEGRVPLESPYNEYFFGEVVYDGKRWHIYMICIFLFVWIVSMNHLIGLHFYVKDLEQLQKEEEEKREKSK